MKTKFKRLLTYTMLSAMLICMSSITVFAQSLAEEKTVYKFTEDYQSNTQGPVWYAEYRHEDTTTQMLWRGDWGCFYGEGAVVAMNSSSGNPTGYVAGEPGGINGQITWVAPRDGYAKLSVEGAIAFERDNTIGKCQMYVTQNDTEQLFKKNNIVAPGQNADFAPVTVEVKKGDRISYGSHVLENTNVSYSVTFSPVVTYVPEKATVGSVSLEPDQKSMNVGDRFQLTANVLPEDAEDKSVNWNSSDALVATVNENGLVTAIGAGQATITVTTADGNKEATCEISVEKHRSSETYYLDSINGDNSNSGTAPEQAWKTLEKVSAQTFVPGDKLLIKAGTTYTGSLRFSGSGSSEEQILVDMYSYTNNQLVIGDEAGQRPRIDGEGKVYKTVDLHNQEYITLRNLEVTNLGAEREDRCGVAVEAANFGVLNGIHLDRLYVHDVNGDIYHKETNQAGKIVFNGGIYFTVSGEANKTRFNDILVENCKVQNVSREGVFVGWTDASGRWNGHNGSIPDEVITDYAHTNVVIRNNYVKDVGGDAIVALYSDKPLIEYNISDGASQNTKNYSMYNAGIWPWRCRDAVFQFNEAYNTVVNGDGQGFDCDWSENTVYQYNYSHDNGGGFMLVCLDEAIGSVIRYNVSQNDHDSLVLCSNPNNADIYNNTFYIGPDCWTVVDGGGVLTFRNNIFYNANGEKNTGWGSQATYDTNLYYGFKDKPDDPNAILGDPLFVDPGKGIDGQEGKIEDALKSVYGYQLQRNSPAVNAGLRIQNNGGRDYMGNSLNNGTVVDLGAFESTYLDKESEAEVKNVMDKINAIGKVDLHSKSKIETAREAYERLTEAQKKWITNLNKLVAAEAELKKLEQEAEKPVVPHVPVVPSYHPVASEKPTHRGIPFTDVDTGNWYLDAVKYVYENELMSGVSTTQFAPDVPTNRAMIVTILHRMEKQIAPLTAAKFDDVAQNQWYTDAVSWAKEKNVVDGYGNGKFAPMNPITREQLAAILYRYAKLKGYDVSASTNLNNFTDTSSVNTWAESAVKWAVAEGLINGMDGKLVPQGSATRAQVAAILMRFCKNIVIQ